MSSRNANARQFVDEIARVDRADAGYQVIALAGGVAGDLVGLGGGALVEGDGVVARGDVDQTGCALGGQLVEGGVEQTQGVPGDLVGEGGTTAANSGVASLVPQVSDQPASPRTKLL